jgi:hypothetical protein
MNTRPRPAPPGGVFHVAHMLTANDATTLTLNDAEQTGPDGTASQADSASYASSPPTVMRDR